MIYNFFAGIIIGSGLILPGVSGGVLAVILNVYEKSVYAINNFFKDIKKNTLFLLPMVLGILVGVVLLGKILKVVFNEYYVQSCFTFMGLVLGGIPILFKKANEKGKANKIIIIISLVLSILLFVLGKNKFDLSQTMNSGIENFIKLFISGFIFVSGKVIPGISSSFMMMLIGMYDYILNIISDPFTAITTNFVELIPLMLGMLVGIIVFIKLINMALKRWYSTTYSIIIGFVIGSLPAIYPGFSFNVEGLISILLFIISFLVSYKFSCMDKK